MAEHQKVQVVESEKSPKVLSSNWKEEVLLDRDMRILQRSEHAIISKITMEQKIMNKRFQKKIHRAKLMAARMSGDKVLESQLRARTISGLNTDVGKTPYGEPPNNPETQALRSVWERGKMDVEKALGREAVESLEGLRKTPRATSTSGPRSARSGSVSRRGKMLDLIEMKLHQDSDEEEELACPISLRPMTAFAPKRDGAVQTEGRRPKTVTGGRSFQGQQAPPQILEDKVNGNVTTGESETQPEKFLATITTYLSPHDTRMTPSAKPPQRMNSARSSSRLTLGSMFGPASNEKTLLDIQKERVRSANYESRIQEFAKRVKPLATKNIDVDYYASKMKMNKNFPQEMTDTSFDRGKTPCQHTCPEVRSLTLKSVDMNFNQRPSTFIDVDML